MTYVLSKNVSLCNVAIITPTMNRKSLMSTIISVKHLMKNALHIIISDNCCIIINNDNAYVFSLSGKLTLNEKYYLGFKIGKMLAHYCYILEDDDRLLKPIEVQNDHEINVYLYKPLLYKKLLTVGFETTTKCKFLKFLLDSNEFVNFQFSQCIFPSSSLVNLEAILSWKLSPFLDIKFLFDCVNCNTIKLKKEILYELGNYGDRFSSGYDTTEEYQFYITLLRDTCHA